MVEIAVIIMTSVKCCPVTGYSRFTMTLTYMYIIC